MPIPQKIQVKALCRFQRGHQEFVVKMYDRLQAEDYYRPIGGTVEFGETTQAALVRELHEELQTKIESVQFLAVLENLFVCEGQAGHEIIYLYQAQFSDPRFYQEDQFVIKESDGKTFTAHWLPRQIFLERKLRLVPESLLKILETEVP